MPRHDTDIRLRHMLDAAREAVQMAQGKTRAALDSDRPLNLSLVRLLEIVGEAASRVPSGDRATYASVLWIQIVGLRNRLIHGYRQRELRHPLANRHPRSATADCWIGEDTISDAIKKEEAALTKITPA